MQQEKELENSIAQSQALELPQPDQITTREKEDAMGAYLMMFAAWGVGLPLPLINLIAAIVYYIINKKSSSFVSFHAYQSLLTQVPITILNAGVITWIILIFSLRLEDNAYFYTYLIFVVLWNLVYMIFSVIACIQARKGRFFYFWVFGRMAFARYYRNKDAAPKIHRNLPPEGL